ncbi:MAG: glycosyltransferase family 2 protein [Patescibacteria group bacterium]|nr:glycosyltransferase family 2 protein [Patescibacteria group bacterium]
MPFSNNVIPLSGKNLLIFTNKEMPRTTVSFIIITYNSEKCIKKCLASVNKNKSPRFKTTLVLIDNNSSDRSPDILKKEGIFDTEIICNSQNLGFAKAVNQGINRARKAFDPDFFFLLNPDATLDNNALENVILFHENRNDLLFSSPIIIDPLINRIWFCGSSISWIFQKTIHDSAIMSDIPYKTLSLSGCALCIPKKAIEKVGFFDERFFLYYEDADFCYRAQKAGINLYVVPSSKCFHVESQSLNNETKCYSLVKSGLKFFYKHHSKFAKMYFWLIFTARFTYHKFISKKRCVINGMNDFLKEKT